MLIEHEGSSQYVQWRNLGIKTIKRVMCSPNVFLKITGKQNNYHFHLPKFLKICDNISQKLLRPSQFLEKFMEVPE